MTTYSTSTFSTGIAMPAGSSPEPARVPKGLITTRAVEMKSGWTGQVIVAEEVLLEDGGYEEAHDAEQWATEQVVNAFKSLLSKPAPKRK